MRAHWYQHFFNVALPADPPDREWVSLIDEVNVGWKAAAEFLIKKRRLGHVMIQNEETYQRVSLDAATLLGDLYTGDITFQAANQTNKDIKTQGQQWANSANEFFQFAPPGVAERVHVFLL